MKCKDFYGEIKEIPESEFKLRASVYGLIFKIDGDRREILLVKHLDGYDYPGGGLKIGQTLTEALEREIKEETGYDMDKVSLKLVDVASDHFYHNFKKTAYQTVLIYYTCALKSYDNKNGAQKSDSELQYMGDAEWVPIESLGSIRFYNGVDNAALLEAALKQT